MTDEHRRHPRPPYHRTSARQKSKTVRIDLAGEVNVSGSVQLLVSTNFWLVWAEIAVQHVEEAQALHAQAVSLRDRGQPITGDELRSALVATGAATFAIDGFYGATLELTGVPRATRDAWHKNRTARKDRLVESLKHGFCVSPHIGDWTRELDWLFGLRGHAVHHEPKHEPPVYRPELDSGFSAEHSRYTAEAARRATAFVIELIATCLQNPKPHTRDWTDSNRDVLKRFEQWREAL